ncbi:PGPSD-like protein [Mya arenaria]|uniref:PGPSD-like protein n=1 Tax=Mya arenaria TaxID=6604 RepID=A0ABY7E157_MYAAR|nr:uncharacterized protein LOC128229967 [Mya arenaria]WAR03723.1 PGPSD-like protein [Mya arenaria]
MANIQDIWNNGDFNNFVVMLRNVPKLIVLTFGILAAISSLYNEVGTRARRALPAHHPEYGVMQRVDHVIYCDNATMVTREKWGARPPKQVDRMETPVRVVFIHHAASGECFTEETCAKEASSLQDYHMKKEVGLTLGIVLWSAKMVMCTRAEAGTGLARTH